MNRKFDKCPNCPGTDQCIPAIVIKGTPAGKNIIEARFNMLKHPLVGAVSLIVTMPLDRDPPGSGYPLVYHSFIAQINHPSCTGSIGCSDHQEDMHAN